MEEPYDVIIAGGGPAGSSLAILLAQAGWRTLLMDAGRFPRSKVCGECVPAAALKLADRLGVGPQVRARAVSHDRLRIRLPDGTNLALALDHQGAGPVLGISRHAFDWLLLERAQTCGVETLLEHRAQRVLFESGRVCGLEASAATPGEPRLRLRGRIVIAADGRASKLVRQTGRIIAHGPRLIGLKQHFAGADPSVLLQHTIDMHSFHGGYLGVCHVETGALNVCGLLPRSVLRQQRGNLVGVLQKLLPASVAEAFAAGSDRGDWLTIPSVQQQTARPRLPGVLYVGDAQGTVEPLAGQGMYMALSGAALAADLLLCNSQRVVDTTLQRRYDTAWRLRFRSSIRWAQSLGWLLRHPRVLTALVHGPLLPRQGTEAVARMAYRATLSGLRHESRNRHGQRRRISAS